MSLHQALLTPLDYFLDALFLPTFLIIPTQHLDITEAVATLNRGLAQTCAQTPYLKGHVTATTRNGPLAITWAEDDPPVQLGQINPSVPPPSYAELEKQRMPLTFFNRALLPVSPPDASLEETGKARVLIVSYTVIDGALIICTCIHHQVMDATGMSLLYERWSMNTRCSTEPTPLPESPADREIFTRAARLANALPSVDVDSRNLKKMLAQHPELEIVPTIQEELKSAQLPGAAAVPRLFTFSNAKLGILRGTLSSQAHSNTPMSKNTVLLALLWSRISLSRLRHLERREQTAEDTTRSTISTSGEASAPSKSLLSTLKIAVNARKHVFIAVDSLEKKTYPGNCILHVPTSLTLGGLAGPGETTACELPDATAPAATTNGQSTLTMPAHLISIVEALNATISAVSRDSVTAAHTLSSHVSASAEKTLRWVDLYGGRHLVTSSWANMSFYQDFGSRVGKVEWVRVPIGRAFDGMLSVMPRRPGGNSDFEVGMALDGDVMAELERDEVLRCWMV